MVLITVKKEKAVLKTLVNVSLVMIPTPPGEKVICWRHLAIIIMAHFLKSGSPLYQMLSYSASAIPSA